MKKALEDNLRESKEDEEFSFSYVGKGIRERGYLTPLDLLYIICWKAPSNYEACGKAVYNAFECIRKSGIEGIKAVTTEAIRLARENQIQKSVEKLSQLHGVKTRVASAILAFYDPEKFGVVDVLAWKALYKQSKNDFEPQDYVKYLEDIRKIAGECNMTPRNVDLALWQIGRRIR